MTVAPITPIKEGLKDTKTASAFSNNLQAAFVAIDSLKLLLERLDEAHSLETVCGRAFTPRDNKATNDRECSHARFPLEQPSEVALPDPDKIDVIDYEDHDEKSLCSYIPIDAAKRESARVKIRDLWAAGDLKNAESLVSAQKRIRQSYLSAKKNTVVGLSKTSFLSLKGVKQLMMHPQSKPRLCWTCLSLAFVAWDILVIPLQVFNPPASMFPWSLDLVIVLFWTIDILMSFRTGVFRKGLLIMDQTSVARRYALTWLFPDAVVVIVEWVSVISAATRGVALARSVKLFRFIRLLRVAKVHTFLGAIEHRFSFTAGTLHLFLYNMKLISFFIILIHFLACSWYGLGELDERKGWTIVENVGIESIAYRYFLCARWTLAQVNGRTDLQRRTMMEYAFTCVVIVAAFILISLFISGITNTMMQISTVSGERTKAEELLCNFLDQKGVSAELAMDVRMCFTQRNRNVTDDLKVNDVLKQLPKPMLFELLQQVRAPRLKVHALFTKLSGAYQMPFRHLCAEAVENVHALPDEVIFHAGEACNRMLIVDNGAMIYFSLDKQSRLGSLLLDMNSFIDVEDAIADGGEPIGKGRWVTEAALWTFWETRGRLWSTSMSNMFSIEANDVARVLDLYKDAHALVSFYAVLYVEAIHDGRAFGDVVDPYVVADVTKKVANESASDLVAHVVSVRATQRRNDAAIDFFGS